MKSKKTIVLSLLLLIFLIGGLIWRSGILQKKVPMIEAPSPTDQMSPPSPTPTSNPTPVPVIPDRPKTKPTTPSAAKSVVPLATPPPVTLYKELIPKDIEIVRVYYGQQITGPGSIVEFDINGSGFNAEFEKMITVESGSANVSVKNLKLMTPNQIHGVLVIKTDTPTGAVFPQVLIQGKVVFRAAEPYAVIRPGDVLNVIFTEMGENGRSGRFRIFTNLSEEMYSIFSVTSNADVIRISDLAPHLPFIVEGTLSIGGAAAGGYDLIIKLGEKLIWSKNGIIQVVQPNVGQSGLTQQLRAADGFHRPGDTAKFTLFGSGFQPQDVTLLHVKIDPFETIQSTMIFKSPGRMELAIVVPPEAVPGSYKLSILQDENVLMAQDHAFNVVGKNWTRELKTDPALRPGGKSVLTLTGRDLEQSFIDSIQIEVDSDDLKVGKFSWKSREAATAEISAGAGLPPGDYLIKMTSNGTVVVPQFGSLIKVTP